MRSRGARTPLGSRRDVHRDSNRGSLIRTLVRECFAGTSLEPVTLLRNNLDEAFIRNESSRSINCGQKFAPATFPRLRHHRTRANSFRPEPDKGNPVNLPVFIEKY